MHPQGSVCVLQLHGIRRYLAAIFCEHHANHPCAEGPFGLRVHCGCRAGSKHCGHTRFFSGLLRGHRRRSDAPPLCCVEQRRRATLRAKVLPRKPFRAWIHLGEEFMQRTFLKVPATYLGHSFSIPRQLRLLSMDLLVEITLSERPGLLPGAQAAPRGTEPEFVQCLLVHGRRSASTLGKPQAVLCLNQESQRNELHGSR